MPRFAKQIQQSLPLVAGIVFGLTATWWTSVHAAVLLPNLSLSNLSSGQTVSGVVSLSAQADATGFSSLQFVVSGQNVGSWITSGSCVTSWDTTTMSNGSHTVTAVAADSVGVTVWATPIVVTVQNSAPADTTGPTVSVSAPSAGASVSGTISLAANASDNVAVTGVWFTIDGTTVGSEDASAPYQGSWNTTTVSNGSHTVRALARDAAGNVTTSSAVSVTVSNSVPDTTAPTVAVSSPTGGSTVNGTVTVSATASDNVGVTSVQFTLDGLDLGSADTTSPFSTSWNTTSATNAAHQLRAIARDAAGNTTIANTITVSVNNITADTTAPTVNVTSPAAGATVSGTVTLSASAADNVGVASVQFTVDGADVGSADTSSPYSASWSSSSVSNGSHVVRAVARDAAGNVTTSAGITVTVSNTAADTTAPTVNITSPAAGATVSGTVTLSASASDNVGVASVQFTVDGSNVGSADTSSPYSVSWSSTGVSNGSHVVRAVARDAAGNVTTSAGITVTVSNVSTDTSRPSVSLTAPSSGATVSGSATVSATASDNVGVVSVQFTVDGVSIGAADTSAPWSISWNTAGVSNGSRVLRAIASDAAGNTRTSNSRTVTVNNVAADTTAPTVGVTSPTNGAVVGGVVTVSASASDNVGVSNVQFMLNGSVIGQDATAPYTMAWSTAAVADGPQQILAVARDAAGNQSSSSVTVAVDNTPGSGVPGDINGDGAPDLVFAHTSGMLYSWFMNDRRLVGEGMLSPSTLPNGWVVVSINDFTGDGQSDLLLQESATGKTNVWIMNGLTQTAVIPLSTASTPWRVIGSADLNGDDKADIIWQLPTTGQLYVWLMDGVNMIGNGSPNPGQVALAWRLAGTADFNGDGQDDLLWQHSSTGELVVWMMNGLTFIDTQRLSPAAVGRQWRVQAVADFDGDAQPDLVFQHALSGHLYMWNMNGTVLARDGFLTPAQVSPTWVVVGGR